MKFQIKNKKNMYYSIFFSIIIFIYFISSYKGLGFPIESELQYTKGTFNITKNAKRSYNVIISSGTNGQVNTIFSCAYTPFRIGRASSCGNKSTLMPYIGKEVTVGWYNQDKYLSFGSKLPQLVTIETNNKQVRSYDQVVSSIDSNNSFTLYILLPASLLCPFFLYWIYGRKDKHAMINKNKSN